MRFKSIEIENFKNISHLSLDLDHPLVLIEGSNGSGKSTILEALIYYLTNKLSDNISEYVRVGTDSGFKISGTAVHKGLEYVQEISAGINSTEKTLRITGDREIYQNSDATKKFKELFDPKLVLYSSVSKQHESTGILFETSAERLDKLKEILGLKNIDKAVEMIKEDRKNAENTIKVLSGEVRILKEQKFELLEVPELPDIDNIKQELESLLKEKEIYELKLKEYEKNESEIEAYNQAQKDISEAKEKIEFYNFKISKLEIKDLPEFDPNKHVELVKQHAEITSYITEQSNNTFKRDEFEKDIEIFQKEEQEYKNKISRLALLELEEPELSQEDIDILEKEIIDMQTDKSKLLDQVELAEAGKCPTCGQDYKSDPEHLNKEIEKLSAQLKIHFDKIASVKKSQEAYQDGLKENKRREESRKTFEDEARKKYDDIKKANIKINELVIDDPPKHTMKEADELWAKIEAEEKLKEEYDAILEANESLEEDKRNHENEIVKWETKLETLQKVDKPEKIAEPKKHDENRLEFFTKEKNVYDQKVKEKEKIEIHNNSIEAEAEKNQVNIQEKETTISTLRIEVEDLKQLAKVIGKDFSSHLIDSGSAFIKQRMNEFFVNAYGRYSVDIRKDSRSVQFYYSPNNEDYKSVYMASGHERMLLAQSFRMALNRLQDCGFMALDEIDSDADDENAVLLYSNIVKEPFDQLICITHNSRTKEFLRNECNAKVVTL